MNELTEHIAKLVSFTNGDIKLDTHHWWDVYTHLCRKHYKSLKHGDPDPFKPEDGYTFRQFKLGTGPVCEIDPTKRFKRRRKYLQYWNNNPRFEARISIKHSRVKTERGAPPEVVCYHDIVIKYPQ